MTVPRGDALGADEFESLRPHLLRAAYRVVGDDAAAAEDVVQEAWIRVQRSEVRPESPRAYLLTVVTRLALHERGSARSRREVPVPGQELDPLAAAETADPSRALERSGSIEDAAEVLLQRLSASERAAFLLHDVFSYSFAEVGAYLGRSDVACRQLASRARRHLAAGRARFPASEQAGRDLVVRLALALQDGEVRALTGYLCEQATVHPDQRGTGPGLRSPVTGSRRVARLLATLGARLTEVGARLEVAPVGSGAGIVLRDPSGGVVLTVALTRQDGRVLGLHPTTDPERIRVHGSLGDLEAVRRALHGLAGRP